MNANQLYNAGIGLVNAGAPAAGRQTGKNTPMTTQKAFSDVLSGAVDGSLRFSKHASSRINSREVDLTPEQIKRVEEGVIKAHSKGVSDSLVLVDGYALLVNTQSRTVITAMDSREKDGGVFTNINGAVIV